MSGTIEKQSEALQAAPRERLPAEVAEVFARDRDALVASDASPRAATAESLSTAEKQCLRFAVLSNAGARVARSLGIAFKPVAEVLEAQRALGLDITQANAEGSEDPPIPTVLVADRDRVVRFADVQPDYTTRTEVPAILSALAELGSQPSLAGGVYVKQMGSRRDRRPAHIAIWARTGPVEQQENGNVAKW
jgi:hypothetical protein